MAKVRWAILAGGYNVDASGSLSAFNVLHQIAVPSELHKTAVKAGRLRFDPPIACILIVERNDLFVPEVGAGRMTLAHSTTDYSTATVSSLIEGIKTETTLFEISLMLSFSNRVIIPVPSLPYAGDYKTYLFVFEQLVGEKWEVLHTSTISLFPPSLLMS